MGCCVGVCVLARVCVARGGVCGAGAVGVCTLGELVCRGSGEVVAEGGVQERYQRRAAGVRALPRGR